MVRAVTGHPQCCGELLGFWDSLLGGHGGAQGHGECVGLTPATLGEWCFHLQIGPVLFIRNSLGK